MLTWKFWTSGNVHFHFTERFAPQWCRTLLMHDSRNISWHWHFTDSKQIERGDIHSWEMPCRNWISRVQFMMEQPPLCLFVTEVSRGEWVSQQVKEVTLGWVFSCPCWWQTSKCLTDIYAWRDESTSELALFCPLFHGLASAVHCREPDKSV